MTAHPRVREGFVNVVADLPADAQAAEPVQQGDGLLDHPAVSSAAGAVRGAAAGDDRLDALGPDQGAGAVPRPHAAAVPPAAVPSGGGREARGREQQSGLRSLRSRGRLRGVVALLGPAFVAAVAYVDPGNFATNFSAGAQFGYGLAWVVVVANLMAMLVQYLSAKVGGATGQDLRELRRDRLPPAVPWGPCAQAELIAMATDLAEFIGAAVGLNLVFGVPLLPAGLITAVIAFGILALEQRDRKSVV